METTTRAGCSVAIRSRMAFRHVSHSVYTRLSEGSQMAMSAGAQADFVNDSSRQPYVVAARTRAGNHCAACESPKSTTVVDEPVSPYAHGPEATAAYGRWHP